MEELEGFELFNNQAVSRIVNKITITKNYMLNFPSAFYTLNEIKNARSALLYYNKQTKQIAIEFKMDVNEKGFKITAPNNGMYGGYITAKNFFILNDLMGKIRTGRYDYEKKEIKKGLDNISLYLIELEYNN